MVDPIIAGRFCAAQFQAVEHALAAQRRTAPASCLKLAHQRRHDRIAPQLVMVDQVLIAERAR
jgi:hypothetical protein